MGATLSILRGQSFTRDEALLSLVVKCIQRGYTVLRVGYFVLSLDGTSQPAIFIDNYGGWWSVVVDTATLQRVRQFDVVVAKIGESLDYPHVGAPSTRHFDLDQRKWIDVDQA